MQSSKDSPGKTPKDLAEVRSRIQEKRQTFKEYNFGPLKDDALKTFFDLAQEYETLENFYRVTVGIIKEFFDLESALHLLTSDGTFELVCDTKQGFYPEKTPSPSYILQESSPYAAGKSWVIPLRGNRLLVDRLPFYAKE